MLVVGAGIRTLRHSSKAGSNLSVSQKDVGERRAPITLTPDFSMNGGRLDCSTAANNAPSGLHPSVKLEGRGNATGNLFREDSEPLSRLLVVRVGILGTREGMTFELGNRHLE